MVFMRGLSGERTGKRRSTTLRVENPTQAARLREYPDSRVVTSLNMEATNFSLEIRLGGLYVAC